MVELVELLFLPYAELLKESVALNLMLPRSLSIVCVGFQAEVGHICGEPGVGCELGMS